MYVIQQLNFYSRLLGVEDMIVFFCAHLGFYPIMVEVRTWHMMPVIASCVDYGRWMRNSQCGFIFVRLSGFSNCLTFSSVEELCSFTFHLVEAWVVTNHQIYASFLDTLLCT